MIKQNFRFQWKDNRVFGCSFRKANYTDIYFGWVTVYENEQQYNHPTRWTDYKNIPLETDKLKSLIAIKEFCKTL